MKSYSNRTRLDEAGNERVPAWAERLVRFLDDGFVVPGTSFRIGFDAVLGLVPGFGDFVTTASGLSLVWLASERGVPKAVLVRMLLNLAVDALAGAVPVFGDLFDLVYKANRRNLELLERCDRTPRQAEVRSGMFLASLVVGVLLLLTIPFVLAILLVRALLG